MIVAMEHAIQSTLVRSFQVMSVLCWYSSTFRPCSIRSQILGLQLQPCWIVAVIWRGCMRFCAHMTNQRCTAHHKQACPFCLVMWLCIHHHSFPSLYVHHKQVKSTQSAANYCYTEVKFRVLWAMTVISATLVTFLLLLQLSACMHLCALTANEGSRCCKNAWLC